MKTIRIIKGPKFIEKEYEGKKKGDWRLCQRRSD
jgi:hypothetical protein